jgi:PKD repeat protein
MRKIWLPALCLLATLAQAQTTLVPTTTLTVETSNNTSAPDTIGTYTQGHAASGNISKVPMRTLLYSSANTKVYAALMGWFGKSGHINVGYSSQDLAQLNKQMADMKSRGIDGAIFAWYGKDSYANKTSLGLKTAAEANGVEFSLMIDRGTLDWDSMGLAPTDALIVHLNYMADTYYGSPMYTRINGRPVVYEFALEAFTIDWNRVRSSIRGNPLIIFRNPNGWTRSTSDGAYAWEPDKATLSYLDYFYKQATLYPTQQTVGGVSPMMNDTLASWSQNRIVDPQCGQTWLMKWNDQSKWYSAANPLKQIQIATWNDYEEGTTIESGIDNCITVNAVMSGSSVTWSLSGAGLENTIDHYTVFISADGQNLMPLVDVPTGTYSVDLDPYKFLKGNYAVYVKAVGKPAITNKMSTATYYAATYVPNQPPVAALSLSASSAYAPSTVTANASGSYDSDGSIASTLIEWGDGTTSSGSVASHAYKAAGTYMVRATVTDNSGASAAITSSISVLPANVTINAPTASSTSGMIVHVDATAFNGNKVDGMWAYVDRVGVFNSKGGSLVADLKMNPGTHTVQVKAWDIYGTITQTSVQVNVVNQSPIAAMALSAASAPTGTAITVSNTGSYDPDGTIASTVIDFGDGFTANAASAAHAYAVAGTYTVKVTVTDAVGATASSSSQVVIANRAPSATVALSSASVPTGTAINVTASGSDLDGSIASTTINFGDGTSANGNSAAHAYTKAGTYTITVTVTDNVGATGTAQAKVTVTNRAPVAKINLSASSLWLGTALSVNSAGSSDPDGAIVATKISFGDGTSVNGTSASRTYVAAGTYTVTVTVTDDSGASASASATVLVNAAGVTITKPAQNSGSLTTSVNIAANANAPRGIASMMIYVDNVKKYTIYGSSLNTYITIPKGTHTVQVKAWENTVGTIYQSSVVTTVK